jgi:hypothetical protein
MKWSGDKRVGPFWFGWALWTIPRPRCGFLWELETMSFHVSLGNGYSDDIVCVGFTVPERLVRRINWIAGYR